jgi:hypothetical protein
VSSSRIRWSIVACDCLRAFDWPVETFVTIGSPLGNRDLVLAHLDRVPVGQWAASMGEHHRSSDQVCAGSQLAGIYDRVEALVVDNGHRGHDPEPCLCAARPVRCCRDARL